VNDADTGLVYMQQRYYDPIAARFLSVDPITTDANTGNGFNLYEYAQSNPYRYTDPDGRDSTCSPGMGGCTVTVFSGTPQSTGTPNHDAASQNVGQAAANQGAAKVHYNQALSTVTGDPSMGAQKPDVSVVWKDGKVSTVEIVSNSQSVSSQEAKGQAMQAKLATIGRAGEVNTLTVKDAMGGNATVRASGVLGLASAFVRAADIGKIESQTGGSVPFGVGLGYLAGHVSREQVVNAASGGMQ
jgi:RHS repeat-associated protein